MKTRPLNVHAFEIAEAPQLDPIRVILQDISAGQGRVIIGCYGQGWECYWPAMGERSVGDFFCDCEPEYLADRLQHGRQSNREREYLLRIVRATQEGIRADAMKGVQP